MTAFTKLSVSRVGEKMSMAEIASAGFWLAEAMYEYARVTVRTCPDMAD